MSKPANRRAGWILIAIGLFFLLQYILEWEFYWAAVLMVLGAVVFVHAAVTRNHRGVFPGTLLLLLGLFFLLMEVGVLEDSMEDLWPLILIILGVSFVMAFLFQPREWGHLIPGGILIVIGLLFFLWNYRFISWRTMDNIFHWWPVILVILGVWLLSGRKRSHG
jgi:hypothetical protein